MSCIFLFSATLLTVRVLSVKSMSDHKTPSNSDAPNHTPIPVDKTIALFRCSLYLVQPTRSKYQRLSLSARVRCFLGIFLYNLRLLVRLADSFAIIYSFSISISSSFTSAFLIILVM